MEILKTAEVIKNIHSDIRGPVFFKALEMEKEGQKVLKLNTGNPAAFGFKMPLSVKQTLIENIDKSLGYCGIRGMMPALQAIVDYEKSKGIEDITTDDVFICNGVSEAANMSITALINPGEEVLIPCPCYSLWTNSVLQVGGVPVLYTCDEQSDWMPDLKDIESKITSKTKAIVVINPNNPTGALYSDDMLISIANLARKYNLVVYSDEIYDRLVLDGLTHTSFAKLAPDLTVITFNGLSKSHCLCGFRCGWIVLSGKTALRDDIRKALVTLASVRLCSNAVMQLIIPTALADTEYTKQMISPGGRIYEQREAVFNAIENIEGLSCVKTRGAFYSFPKIDTTKFNVTDDKQFAFDLLQAKKILIVAGSGFGWKTPDHFRVVMLPEVDALSKAMYDIGDYLQTIKK